MCANQTYEFTLEDENNETEYNKIVARVRTKIFEPSNIEIISVITKVKESLQ
jgi:hypothetical protein